MTVFNTDNKTGIQSQKLFFGEPPSIARYDQQRFPQFGILVDKMRGVFWVPSEVGLTQDIKDFRGLSDHEKHIFTMNLRRQILLDSVQGRAPVAAFLPICSSPELESAIIKWTEQETVHSDSYSHIIQNVYSNPSEVFDDILNIQEIVDCAGDISKYYDNLIDCNHLGSCHFAEHESLSITEYHHKKSLWMALHAVNALEGIRFYVSFACSWAFAEQKKMEGNAKVIKLICRDENIHMALTQKLLQLLPQTDEDFLKIKVECVDEVKKLFESVVEQEKQWADYLFKDGSMLGLNANVLKDYVEYMARKRMKTVDIPCDYKITQNPLPWTDKWIAGSDVQVAPQETDKSEYIIGGIDNDVSDETFSNFTL
jgi:ribonucleoside-diphosphate reductase beta chain